MQKPFGLHGSEYTQRCSWPDGEQTPLFAWHATLAFTFHKIEIVSYQTVG